MAMAAGLRGQHTTFESLSTCR